MIKRQNNGPIRRQFGTCLTETIADVGDGSRTVVGQAIHDDQRTPGTKPLVTRGLEVIAPSARCLLDRLVDHVAGHVVALCFFDEAEQRRISVWVGHSVLGRHVQLSTVFGKELRLLRGGFEDRSFTLLEDSSHASCALLFSMIRDFPGQETLEESRFAMPVENHPRLGDCNGTLTRQPLRKLLRENPVTKPGQASCMASAPLGPVHASLVAANFRDYRNKFTVMREVVVARQSLGLEHGTLDRRELECGRQGLLARLGHDSMTGVAPFSYGRELKVDSSTRNRRMASDLAVNLPCQGGKAKKRFPIRSPSTRTKGGPWVVSAILEKAIDRVVLRSDPPSRHITPERLGGLV